MTNFYPLSRDKLIIGKFCQIAAGVEFVMNDANHQMNTVTTFPFYTLEGWEIADMAPCGVSAGGTLAMNLAYNGHAAIPVRFVFQLAGPTWFDPADWGLL